MPEEESKRPEQVERYRETLKLLKDRISDNQGNESIPLSEADAKKLAQLAKEGKINPEDWGLTTVEALEQAKPFRNQLFLIAGGGIRSGIDLAKAMSLGASMGSAALPFLKAALESKDAVVKLIEEYREQFKVALFLTGHKNCKDER